MSDRWAWATGVRTLGTVEYVTLFLLLGTASTAAPARQGSPAEKGRENAAIRGVCASSCDDGNPCTVDSCDRRGRCHNVDVARCAYPHAATLLPLPSGSSCTPISSCSIPDTDGDGLNDAWEIQGGVDLNCDGEIDPKHDLLLPAADPLKKDVYLEYAYMVLPDQGTACAAAADCSAGQSCSGGICRGHSHAPSHKAIRAVVDAFERQGIALHVDRGAALPHHPVVTYDPVDPVCSGSDAVNFYDQKAQFFDSRRMLAYHYAIFGHYNTCGSAAGCSLCSPGVAFGLGGRAELPGNDFIISTGAFFDAVGIHPGTEHEAGLLMHELGHNLNLRHAGDGDLPDFKPNYLSAINDAFVYPGIPVAGQPGSTNPISCQVTADCPPEAICGSFSHVCTRIDYSSEALPTLDESNLDENAGIGGTTNDITSFVCPASLGFEERAGAGIGPIDWNCNGVATETNLTADINADGAPPPTPTLTTLLTGHADWPNLQLGFQCTARGSENAPPPPDGLSAKELSIPDAARKHVLLARRSVEVDVRRAKPGETAFRSGPPEVVVTILGADDLDVGSIEHSSLRLAGSTPRRLEHRDVNGDGRADLVATFDESRLKRHPQANADRLTGWLRNSQAFAATVPR